MKISIIVPVYKAEQYLDKCIESILNQTFNDFELILVDDGSPDGSGKICDEWAKKDNRIVVIHKENSGVSAARNTALDIANGEYIGFVDSDDTIEPTMYETLYNNMRDYNAQISVCDFRFVSPNRVRIDNLEIQTQVYDSKEAIEIIFKDTPFSGHLCNKLFKADLFDGVRLDEDIYIFEDMLAVLRILMNPIKIVYHSEPLYSYHLHDASASHFRLTEAYVKSSNAACFRMTELMAQKGSKRLVAMSKIKPIKSDLQMLIKISGDEEGRKKYSKAIIRDLKKQLSVRSFFQLNFKLKIKVIMAVISPRMYFKAVAKKQKKAN